MGNSETSIRKHKVIHTLQTENSTASYSKENNGQVHKLCMQKDHHLEQQKKKREGDVNVKIQQSGDMENKYYIDVYQT